MSKSSMNKSKGLVRAAFGSRAAMKALINGGREAINGMARSLTGLQAAAR